MNVLMLQNLDLINTTSKHVMILIEYLEIYYTIYAQVTINRNHQMVTSINGIRNES